MKNYLLILSDGSAVDVKAASYQISGPEISFLDEDGKTQIAYAPKFIFVSLKRE